MTQNYATRMGRFRTARLSQAIGMALAGMMAVSLVGVMPRVALAQSQEGGAAVREYRVAAGQLGSALGQFAAQAGIVLSFDPALTRGLHTQGLSGSYDVRGGLAALLAGSGLEAVAREGGSYGLRAIQAGAVSTLDAVTVAGRRASDLPPGYAGGQVASGARLGMLGNADLMDAPFTINAYTAEHIQNMQSSTVAQVLQSDPSVRFTTSAGHVYENFTIRGQDINASDVAFDGLYGLAPDGHIPTEFLERVEVLRGPSALLSGMAPGGNVAGMVNIVPKRAGDVPVTDLTVDYVSDSNIGTHVDIGRRFGDQDRFGVRFNGAWREGDTGVDGQSKQRDLAALSLDWRGDGVRLSLDAFYDEEETRGGSPMMVGLSNIQTVVTPPDNKTNILRGIHARQRSDAVMVRGEYDLGERWTAYAAFGSAHSDYSGYLNGTRGRLINTAGDYRGETYQQRGGRTVGSGETGLRGSFETGAVRHEVAMSATLLSINSRNRSTTGAGYDSNIYDPVDPVLAPRPADPRKTGDTRLTSLALADTLAFADDAIRLTLGARLQRVESRSWNQISGALTGDYDKRALTPAVGLVVKPWGPDLALYANFIEGLSQGGTVTDTGASNHGQVFKPFRSRQIETGVKWDIGSWTQTLSLYQLERPSMIKVDEGSSYHYTDDGEQRSRGIEWNVFGELTPAWRVLGGASYNRVQLTRTADGVLDGNTRYGMPKWNANLGLEWDIPGIQELTLSGRVVYTGRQFVDNANTYSLPSWTRVDAGLRYATRIGGRDVTLRAAVENVADRSYWEGSFNEGFATLNAPRTFKLSATIGF